jgi:aspartyl-tRNA synthetase
MDLQKLTKNRTRIGEVFQGKKSEVEVVGWVSKSRALGKIKFVMLRDVSGLIQVIAIQKKTNKKIFELMDKLTRESVIYVKGKVVSSKQAPGGKEIIPEKIEIISEAESLPIDVSEHSKTELPKRLDYRFLDLHRRKTQAIFKIQSEIANSFREYFYKKDFLEVQLPSIIKSSSEGGTELFPVKYFEKSAYLAQSPQLYKQMLACSAENVFTITPVWRAEKHNTVRHLNESRQMDIEMVFADQFVVMKELEEVVKIIIQNVLKKCKSELELLELKLEVPKAKYLSYEETCKLLKIKYGEDLSPENEKELNRKFPETIVFVHSWPSKIKPFYIMPKGENSKSKESEGFDTIYRGLEISSGGQRVHIPDLLEEMLKSKKLNPKDFKYYVDSFRYGAPPHAGWSIGLERLTQLITEQSNIREAVLFPRDRDRLVP